MGRRMPWPRIGVIAPILLSLLLVESGPAKAKPPPPSKGYHTEYLKLEDREAKAMALFKKAMATRDLKERERLYLEVLKLWPSYALAYNNLADTYEKQGRFKEAIKNYEIALALAPNVPLYRFGLGDVYFKLGEFKRAVRYYRDGLKVKPDDELSRRRLGLAQALSRRVFFGFDSWRLTPEAKRILKQMALAMKDEELKGRVFEIAGHTDSTGPEAYNLRLSVRRARAVKEFLVKCGIEAQRLIPKGYGEDRPLASNETKEGRRKNRRVEVGGNGKAP